MSRLGRTAGVGLLGLLLPFAAAAGALGGQPPVDLAAACQRAGTLTPAATPGPGIGPGSRWCRLPADPGPVVLAAAMAMLGVPYSWGGGTPDGPSRGIAHGADTVGFDCSGLVVYAWAQAGVDLPHGSWLQARLGQPVSREQLRAGDLLFFATDPHRPGAVTHVGISTGHQAMVHAPRTGDVVRVEALAGYWAAHYLGARRPA